MGWVFVDEYVWDQEEGQENMLHLSGDNRAGRSLTVCKWDGIACFQVALSLFTLDRILLGWDQYHSPDKVMYVSCHIHSHLHWALSSGAQDLVLILWGFFAVKM